MEGESTDWRLLLCGHEAVGKSQLCRLLPAPGSVSFDDAYRPMVGIEHKQQLSSSGGCTVRVNFDVWDGGGRPRFRPITAMYFRSFVPLIALLVYDVTDTASAAALRAWYEHTVKPGAPPNAHVVVVGNKADLLPDGGASLTAAACVRTGRLPAAAVEGSTWGRRTPPGARDTGYPSLARDAVKAAANILLTPSFVLADRT